MISSDEDDESDDEEKAREEMQGFIAVSITKVLNSGTQAVEHLQSAVTRIWHSSLVDYLAQVI